MGTFLCYPRLIVVNPFYAVHLNTWRALSIYVSLMRDPSIISTLYFSERLDQAIEICRSLAALENDPSNRWAGKYFAMLFAKLGFGGRRYSREELDWLLECCAEWGKLFPLAWESVQAFEGLWDAHDNFWIAMNGVISRLGEWWTDRD